MTSKEILNDARQWFIRLLILTNGGGAIAVITFIGTTWGDKGVMLLAASAALVALLLGVCFALSAAYMGYFHLYNLSLKNYLL